MSAAGYRWRQLSQKQRKELLEWRKARGYPGHSPPHRPTLDICDFLFRRLVTNTAITLVLAQTGASETERVWREYPLRDYGKNWDDPEM